MRQLEAFHSCPICGSREASVIVTERQLSLESRYRDRVFRCALPSDTPEYMFDDLTRFTNDYRCRLLECNRCGLVCRDPRFTQRGTIHAYAADQYHPAWLQATFEKYYESFRSQMPRLTRLVGKQARVLEIGSYVGGFLAAARDYGWDAQSVDIGRAVSEFVRSKGLSVLTGTLCDAQFPDNAFDAVFVWVCFDQLPDPKAALSEIRRILAPNGWLFFQVPNGEFLKVVEPIARSRGRSWRRRALKALVYSGLAGFPFQIGFTPATCRILLRSCGFRTIGVYNRVNLSDKKQFITHEQETYLKFVDRANQIVTTATAGRVIGGPWIEVRCRKGTDRSTETNSEERDDLHRV